MERFPSGQREQTVNLSSDDFGGSNPPLSTIPCIAEAGVAQLARASAFQAEGRGFEPRFPLHNFLVKAQVAQQVEHLLGKEEVTGSSPVLSSTLKI